MAFWLVPLRPRVTDALIIEAETAKDAYTLCMERVPMVFGDPAKTAEPIMQVDDPMEHGYPVFPYSYFEKQKFEEEIMEEEEPSRLFFTTSTQLAATQLLEEREKTQSSTAKTRVRGKGRPKKEKTKETLSPKE